MSANLARVKMPRPTVNATPLPPQSALHQRIAPNDFIDCYAVAADVPPRQAAEIITDFPAWAQTLVSLRNLITRPFGLRGEGPASEDSVGLFPVETETKHELIAGFDDRHLNFRVAVLSIDAHVYLATWVHPHNFGGRAYLRTILPAHILIARNALARVARSTV